MNREERPLKGRIGWCVEAADYDTASFRYRCLVPAVALEGRGYRSTLITTGEPEDDVDFVVFVKAFGLPHVRLAEKLTRTGIPFALDLCDNIFGLGYTSKLRFTTADGFRAMASMAAHIVVPTEALAREVRRNTPGCVEPVVVPDAALSEADHAVLSHWHAIKGFQTASSAGSASGLRKLIRRAGSAHRQLSYYRRHPKAALARMRRAIGWVGDDGRNADSRPRKVIWFGKHGTSHSDAGMKGLLVTVPYLEKLNHRVPIELVVVSNNHDKFSAHFGKLGIKTRYRRWSNESVYDEMKKADAFLMPNANDSFSACKSANRALLALASGVPVVATQLESLEPLRDAIVLDDWQRGLERYLFDDEARTADLKRAGEIIDREFSPDAIGDRWLSLLRRPAPTHSHSADRHAHMD
jgi:glycosyltransferase involved in cell wall biosynthesis